VEIDRILEDYAGLLAYVRGVKRSDKRVFVAFDEWNVWYKNMERDGAWGVAPHLLEEVYNLEDALVCAQYLSAFVRQADLVKIACIAQIVNVIAPILTRPAGLLIQSTYHPFRLFSEHAVGRSLLPVVEAPSYVAGARGEVPVLDVSASHDGESGQAGVFIVNRSLTDDVEIDLRFADAAIDRVLGVDVLTGDGPKARNTWERPDVVRPIAGAATVIDGSVRLVAPSLGLTVLRVVVERR
jgi:alpha-N-arabinofuranosidase